MNWSGLRLISPLVIIGTLSLNSSQLLRVAGIRPPESSLLKYGVPLVIDGQIRLSRSSWDSRVALGDRLPQVEQGAPRAINFVLRDLACLSNQSNLPMFSLIRAW